MKGRLSMRGHVAKKGDRYYVVVDIGRDHKNKRQQKWFSGYTRKKDAEKDLPNILLNMEKGYKKPADMTVEQYMDDWLKKKKNSVAHGTYEHYAAYTKNYIIPGIGRWKVSKLDGDIVESFIDELKDNEDIAQRTKKHIFRILSSALKKGKRYGIKDGIMDDIEAPRVEKTEIEYWSLEETRSFLQSLNSKNHSIPFYIALATGMRRGEIMGLRWSRVNFDNQTISVTHQLKQDEDKEGNIEWVLSPQLKTKTSYRTIKIDDDTMDLIKAHKKQQEKDKMKVGPDYGNKDMVCATSIGGYMKPTYLRTVFNRTIKYSGVKRISFHGLRHTHATLLLSDGVHPKIVQERLGHTSIETTLDTYSHITPGIQDLAAKSIGRSMHPEKETKEENLIKMPIKR